MEEKLFLTEFITGWKKNKCLWDPSCYTYVHPEKNFYAYNELLEIMKKYNRGSQIDDVKKKIHSIRTTHRRLLKKVNESEKYTPNIWWFELVDFLNVPLRQAPKISITTDKREEMLSMAYDLLSKEPDNFDLMAKVWADKLRKISKLQRLIAEKAIIDILFEAESGSLKDDTVEIRSLTDLTSSIINTTQSSTNSTHLFEHRDTSSVATPCLFQEVELPAPTNSILANTLLSKEIYKTRIAKLRKKYLGKRRYTPYKRYKGNANRKAINEDENESCQKVDNDKLNKNSGSDECSTFGEHVSWKLRQYTKKTGNVVQHHINNILFEADTGKLKTPELSKKLLVLETIKCFAGLPPVKEKEPVEFVDLE